MTEREYTLKEIIAKAVDKHEAARRKEFTALSNRAKRIALDAAQLLVDVERFQSMFMSDETIIPQTMIKREILNEQSQQIQPSGAESDASLSPVSVTREVLPLPGSEFTVKDIQAKIVITHPDSDHVITLPVLSSTLKRMADNKEIILKQVGRGRRPTIYEVPIMESP